MRRLAGLLLCCLSGLGLAAEPQVRVHSRLVPADGAWVGGTLSLEVDLLVDTWFTDAPLLPTLELPGALVSPASGQAQHLTEQQDGKTFFGLRFSYRITPQEARRYAIPALPFQVYPGQASGPVQVSSPPQAFVARALAGAPSGPALVASGVRFSQDIQRSHEPLRQGDSVTRRLRVEAEGTQAMLIPPPPFAALEGLRRYVQAPVVAPLDDGRGGTLGGRREDVAVYVIAAPGRYRLPAITLRWWDAASGEARSVAVPAVELEAVGGDYRAPFALGDDLRALGRRPRAGPGLLLGLALAGGGALAWLGRPWGRAVLARWRAWRAARQQAWRGSAAYAWQLARRQARARPPQLGGLYLWVRRSHGGTTLAAWAAPQGEAATARVRTLLRARYAAPGATARAPIGLRQLLPDAWRVVTQRRKAAARRHGLKPLNPGLA